ncbi:hypothetical protein [Pseudanabaena minima]|uniref:hypothetical protein n=1 Tax=Pseudanabaena minima TaxID=890415 RepID=UPI003DA810B6
MNSSVALCAFVAVRSLADTLGFNEVSDRTATAHSKCEATIICKTSQHRQQNFLLEITCEAYASLQAG